MTKFGHLYRLFLLRMQACLVLLLLFVPPLYAQPSVAFFYGQDPPMPQSCLYDMLVVDPNATFNPEDCNAFNQTFAYVSVGEVHPNASYRTSIRPEWMIGKNSAWNNNAVLDQTNKAWQLFFINQLITPLWEKGYRGFFLDTLDSYWLAVQDPLLQKKQIDGMVSLIQQIKQRYPAAKIILNRGFQLLPAVHTQIDAVVIESLYHGWNQQKKTYEITSADDQATLQAEITKIRAMQLPIIIIDYLPPSQQQKAQALANELSQQGLIPWIADNELQHIYLKNPSQPLQTVSRKILVGYTEQNKLPIRFGAPLRLIGPILEYMGYIPQYLPLQEMKALRKATISQQYAGVILWLSTQDTKNSWLLDWAQQQIKAGIPIVFLNSFGVPIETKALVKFGLSIAPYQASTTPLTIVKKEARFVGYEVKPSTSPYDFYPLHTKSGQVLLQFSNQHQQTEDAVVITDWGGYALDPFVLQFLPDAYAFWVLNPFEFFHQALRLKDFPVPDTTTENGRRLMSVHVDGDGFDYTAKWIGGGFAGAELRDRILKKFRIPTSVSVITGEIAPNGIHPTLSPVLIGIARSIFELPWVESASHSFSHPFHWQAARHKAEELAGAEPFSINVPHYHFNMATEITGSVNFINQFLMPKNKKCRLFFWSGAADPSLQALQLVQQNGLLNINGVNDTFIDNHHRSITGVRPMGMELGGYYQVFAPIDMDFYYMNSFAGPLYGFERVIQTLKLTDTPRRLKPIDLYYHMYSASNPASLQALTKVYRWALAQPVMNIYISDYIKKVLDYYQIMVAQYHDAWMLYSNGDLRELRSLRSFGYPDLLHSHNILGFKENMNDLYIHLGPHRVSLLKYQKEKPVVPYLVEANARVAAFFRDSKHLMIRFQGYMPLQFTLANMAACQWVSKTPLTVTANPDHTISYQSSKAYAEIHISC